MKRKLILGQIILLVLFFLDLTANRSGGNHVALSPVSCTMSGCHRGPIPSGNGLRVANLQTPGCYTEGSNLFIIEAFATRRPLSGQWLDNPNLWNGTGFSFVLRDTNGVNLGNRFYIFDINCAGGLSADWFVGSYGETQQLKNLTVYRPASNPNYEVKGAACGFSAWNDGTYEGDVILEVRSLLADGDSTSQGDFQIVSIQRYSKCWLLPVNEPPHEEKSVIIRHEKSRFFSFDGKEIPGPITGVYIEKTDGEYKVKVGK
jgi:hypothetical protein